MKGFDLSLYSKYRGALMGFAILGVLLGHGLGWAELRDYSWTKPIGLFGRIAFTEGFLFLSGLGLYYSFRKNGDVRAFYVRRWWRMMFPFMLMALPFYLVRLLCGDMTPLKFVLSETSLYFWFFGNNGMWYISVSVLLYAIFPLLYKFMFAHDKSVMMRSLVVIVVMLTAGGMVYLLLPGYYEMTKIGIMKMPMFPIGMLTAYGIFSHKRLSIIMLAGGYTTRHFLHSQEARCLLHPSLRNDMEIVSNACSVRGHGVAYEARSELSYQFLRMVRTVFIRDIRSAYAGCNVHEGFYVNYWLRAFAHSSAACRSDLRDCDSIVRSHSSHD